ncbi:MAG TPA: T9SS type A sorting domain-containing protein [Candidatus Syntrophosphaera sp.]|nr:T9SS type A sorting domain-containing protein [Candidatus Syntrophosphaera sp.]
MNLYDSYGDGWDTSLLSVYVNGTIVLENITLATGYGPEAYTFSANAGDIISTIFTAGSWAGENRYEILDPNNVVIATDGEGTNPPTGIDVPQPPQPLIAPATGTYTVNLYDSYGDGWDTSLLSVYVNGTIVLENITLATGYGPEAYTFTANTGDEVCTVFKAGAWPVENWYEILDPDSVVIATDGPNPRGIGFISEEILYEPTWGTPDYEFNVNCTTSYYMDAWDTWEVYKFEAVLPQEVVLENGWFSAQIDVDSGASNLFLFAPGTGLDQFSIQHVYAKSRLDKEIQKKLMMVSSGNYRDPIANDIAFTLYKEDVVAPEITFILDPPTPGVPVYLNGELLGYTNDNGVFTCPLPQGEGPFVYTFGAPEDGWDSWQFSPQDNYELIITQNPTHTPVELSSFTATVNAVNNVELTWVSQSEHHMNGYRVYRNTSDQQDSSILITPILIPATNTSTAQTYSITDNSVEIGDTYYYWLEAVDYLSSGFHGPVSVTVEGSVPQVLPEITSLKNAYPNPFKLGSSTTIEVDVKAGETGTLSIYNLSGQLVRSFTVNEGAHSLGWNGRDSKGAVCGSGIYFYKLSTASCNQSRKMVIIK